MEKTTYRSPDLENSVESQFRSLADKVLYAAQTLSFISMGDVITGFRSTHDGMKALQSGIQYRLQSESNQSATDKGLMSKEKREVALEREIANDKERELSLSGYARSGKSARISKRVVLTIGLIILAMGDVIFNEAGLERILFLSQILSYALSIMLACGIAFCAHSWIPTLSKRWQNIALAISAVVFLFLGYLRIADTFNYSLHDMIMVLTFGLISLLMFFAACRIGKILHDTKPSTETIEAEKAYSELMIVRDKLRKNEVELKTLNEGWQKHEGHTFALSAYGAGLEMTYTNKTKALFWEYLRTAKKHNPSADPSIFNITEYPFDFTEPSQSKTSGMGAGAVIIGLCLLAFSSCTNNQPPVNDIAVYTLVDNSVELRVVPDTASLVRLTGLRSEKWDVSLTVGFGTIGDIDYAPMYMHTLKPQNRLFGNVVAREKEIKQFTDELYESLGKIIPPSGSELERTIVYRTVARTAIEVSKLPHKRKILLVYSDLVNNDDVISLYGDSGKKLLKNPEQLEEKFLAQVQLPDLNGLEIYFIYQPKEFAGNSTYNVVSTFFANMFARHGAKTHITATTP